MTEFATAEDVRFETAERIIRSESFRKAPRLSQLLSYLVKHSLDNRTDLLTETEIAIRVFKRDTGFNPQADTIVRSHMVRLRQKLEQYQKDCKREDLGPLRLVLPRGDYLIQFEENDSAATVDGPHPLELGHPDAKPSDPKLLPDAEKQPAKPLGSYRFGVLMGVSVGLLSGILLTMSYLDWSHSRHAISHPLWSLIFSPNRNTLYIAPDSGLVLLHTLSHGPETSLSEYVQEDFRSQIQKIPPDKVPEILEISKRRYTSAVELGAIHRLDSIASQNQANLTVKFSRDVHIEDIKQSNVILGGGRGSTPWHELFEQELNFVHDASNPDPNICSFLNKKPGPGEPSSYTVHLNDPKRSILGLIAFLPNPTGPGKSLIIEGSSLTGGEAADDFLFDDTKLLPFISSIKRPDGSIPYFELLLQSTSINGNAGPFQILSYRLHT